MHSILTLDFFLIIPGWYLKGRGFQPRRNSVKIGRAFRRCGGLRLTKEPLKDSVTSK